VAVAPRDSYPPAFLAAVNRVIANEGGLVCNPADPGGATKFGISSREYPALDIAALTRDDAIAIYYRDWWGRFGFDALPTAIAAKLFDLAVNIGPAHAIKCLQRALRSCERPVAEDGVAGPQTAAAAAAASGFALLAALRSEAAGYYRTTAALARAARPDGDREFLAGWLNRAYE
jgi:lysozyme family protein